MLSQEVERNTSLVLVLVGENILYLDNRAVLILTVCFLKIDFPFNALK